MMLMDETQAVLPPLERLIGFIEKNTAAFLIGTFFVGLIVRLVLLPNPGFEADVSFWKSWGLAQFDHGIVWSIKNTNNNYPTAFAYVLGMMTRVYSIFADPHNFYEYWNNANIIFLTISKLPAVLSDFAIFGIILWVGKSAQRKDSKSGFPPLPFGFYALIAAAYLLNPITIIDGAWWGQVDSVGVLVYLVALIVMLKRMPFLAGFIFMASMMTKLQNMIYGPVFFVLLWQLMGFRGLVRAVAGTITAFVGLNIEFFLAREMRLVFESLTVNYDYFPFMSLNAFNLWWIVAKAAGMKTLDKFSTVGIVNAKTVGLMLFSSGYLLAVLVMVKDTLVRMFKNNVKVSSLSDTRTHLYRFFTAIIIVAASFFLFQTESHDRYAFPLVLYIPLWISFFLYAATTSKERERILSTDLFTRSVLFYIVFSLIYFYNLHTALVFNYPLNGLPFLKDLISPPWTIGASYLQLALFAAFLYAAFRHLPKAILLIPVVFVAAMLAKPNFILLTKKPVLITELTPIISQQEYGKRQTNMSVNSFNGINAWNPLSVQYSFYKHGIGTHARSYHQFHVNGMFTKFTTDYGIDTEAGSKGTATFEIYGDDKALFISDPIGRYDYPRHVEVDITGVKFLGLVTNDAKDGINDDHTDWLNAKLWP
ncbi:hypothetical protein A2Z33_03810 [Candidatus Gottesmanbacteria bacterium RBG_16_52_11]|uniref:Glycosyl hydrolase family 98 putative carbohydrate-binding module domain-containing protein n=1 Tax=Candidatus Gottesmanbacteria bacterium RBG_16_52_11 TaxID=1798374 RepID=A0A1F5YVM3_9BACT|nr:MAG: hypothetical protein A2Z33_03810 [Candidatus Gottesmanbacteria bacterium RBG_16_52_11]